MGATKEAEEKKLENKNKSKSEKKKEQLNEADQQLKDDVYR